VSAGVAPGLHEDVGAEAPSRASPASGECAPKTWRILVVHEGKESPDSVEGEGILRVQSAHVRARHVGGAN
jgi:hypothetical protein